jgi:hypothetical protein
MRLNIPGCGCGCSFVSKQKLQQQQPPELGEEELTATAKAWASVHLLIAVFDRDSHVTSADEALGQVSLSLAKLRPVLRPVQQRRGGRRLCMGRLC